MTLSDKDSASGFTLIEVILIIATVAVLVIVLIPALAKQNGKQHQEVCVNQLKQVGLSFRIWAGDSSDAYPMARSTNDGGTMEFVKTPEVFQHFLSISNELGSPQVLICPTDKKRRPAKDFSKLGNINLSYFVGVDASENLPQSILSGDRNITNGFAPTNGMLTLIKNQLVGWTKDLHKSQGNIALGDGIVQPVSSALLKNEIVANSDLVTNRIILP